MVNGQRWPGASVVHTGYGVPGAVSVDRNGELIVAREHKIGGVVNGGTQCSFDPINASREIYDTSALHVRLTEYVTNFSNSQSLGGLSLDSTRELGFESLSLLSPGIIDPHFGQRVHAFHDQIMYADGSFVKIFSLNEENDKNTKVSSKFNGTNGSSSTNRRKYRKLKNAKTDSYLDMRSPILQIDADGIVRTRKGLASVNSVSSAKYFKEGDFMHSSSCLNGKVVATTPSGEVQLIDVETGEVIWSSSQPQGTLSGFNRVVPLGEQEAIWANQYTMAHLDFRQDGNGVYNNSLNEQNVVLDFPDRQREIKDLGVDVHGNVFALTSYQIMWICGQPAYEKLEELEDSENIQNNGVRTESSPASTVDHAIAKNDWSNNMFVGQTRGRTLVTVTSQISSLTTAAFFERNRDTSPVLMDDLYYLESWPSIMPQSHMTIETAEGFDLYSVGTDGGLYRQHWIETGMTSSMDALLDMPPADNKYDNTNTVLVSTKGAITPYVVNETTRDKSSDKDNNKTHDNISDGINENITRKPEGRSHMEYVTPYDFVVDGTKYRSFESPRQKAFTDVYDMHPAYEMLLGSARMNDGEAGETVGEKANEDGKKATESDIEISTDVNEKLRQFGVNSEEELLEKCEQQYSSGSRSRLSKVAIADVKRQIKEMVSEISEAVKNTKPVITRPDSELKSSKDTRQLLNLWPISAGDETEIMSSQPSSFSQASSQPESSSQFSQPFTQAVPVSSQMSLSQPSLGMPSLSQPTSGMSKKRKHKKRKHR